MDADVSTAAALAQVAVHDPGAPSLVYGSATTSAAGLAAGVRALADALAAAGVQPGDRVAHIGRNSASLLLTVLACGPLRAVAVPLGFRSSAAELADLLARCTPRVVVAEPAHVAAADTWPGVPGTPGTPGGRGTLRVQVDDDPLAGPPEPRAGWHPWSALLAAGDPGAAAPHRARPDDTAVLLFTSGSSGRPKGVPLTHANLWWSAVGADAAFGTGHGGTTLAVAPMSHIGGLNGLGLRTLGTGGTLVVRRAFDADAVLHDIARHGVTSLFGVPAMYAALARSPWFDGTDLSSLRTALVGGAPLPAGLLRRFTDRGVPLMQSWGMTETAPACTCVPRDRVADRGTTVGLPLAHVRLRLVDPRTGTDVDRPGEPGELWVSGPQVTAGYWRDPEATAQAFPEPGWLRTGDVAVRDADGAYRIQGRIGDVINTGGEKVHPAEVEAALEDCPGVGQCAVAGVPDDVWGEAVAAVVVPAPGTLPDLADLREHAARTIGRHKLPRRLVLVDALPCTGTGKVDRAQVRRIAAGAGAELARFGAAEG